VKEVREEVSGKNKTWGIYPWFEEHGADLIHVDDLAIVRSLMPNGKIFELVGEKDGFLRLCYGDTEFRAHSSLFRAVLGDVHGVGETVVLKDGRAGEVVGVHWHHQRAEPMYELRLEGKKRTSRYWNSDLA
jgi:hypothetical protein